MENPDVNVLLKGFPFISEEINMIAFDLVRVDKEEELYNVLIRFIIANHDDEEIEGGFTLMTGIAEHGYDGCAKVLENLVQTGMFFQTISAMGTVYDENMDEIEDISWNDLLETLELTIPEGTILQ